MELLIVRKVAISYIAFYFLHDINITSTLQSFQHCLSVPAGAHSRTLYRYNIREFLKWPKLSALLLGPPGG